MKKKLFFVIFLILLITLMILIIILIKNVATNYVSDSMLISDDKVASSKVEIVDEVVYSNVEVNNEEININMAVEDVEIDLFLSNYTQEQLIDLFILSLISNDKKTLNELIDDISYGELAKAESDIIFFSNYTVENANEDGTYYTVSAITDYGTTDFNFTLSYDQNTWKIKRLKVQQNIEIELKEAILEHSKELFINYLEQFVNDGTIADYSLDYIAIEHYDLQSILIYIEYSELPASDQYVLSGNGVVGEDNWVREKAIYLRIVKIDNVYSIDTISGSP